MPGAARQPPPNHDAAGRRASIVRASARLFHDKGFETTTVRDIAAAVGMQSGSPFYHFESKHEILFAVIEQGLRHAIERSERAADGALQPAQRFRALVRAQFGMLHETGSEYAGVMLADWRSLLPEHRERLAELCQRFDAIWQRTLDELHGQGRLAVDAQLARRLIVGAINGSTAWRGAAQPDLDAVAEATARLVLRESDREAALHAELDALRGRLVELRAELAGG